MVYVKRSLKEAVVMTHTELVVFPSSTCAVARTKVHNHRSKGSHTFTITSKQAINSIASSFKPTWSPIKKCISNNYQILLIGGGGL